jgi:hypothetical protein
VAHLPGVAAAVSAAAAGGGPLGVPSCSEPTLRRAVCVERARTDLWEPWVGNRPGPPGEKMLIVTSSRLETEPNSIDVIAKI